GSQARPAHTGRCDRMHRALRIVSTALITAGIVVLLDVAMTLIWKEPMSTVYGSIQQGDAKDSLAELQEAFPDTDELTGLEDAALARRIARIADRFEDKVEVGNGIGTIRIPSIDLDMVFVEGTDS